MNLINKFINWFRDSAERRRFLNEFNENAKNAFMTLSVDTLLEAKTTSGNPSSSFRHEMSAPTMFSGLTIEAKAGVEIPVEDIILIGKIILSNRILVRRTFVLHWDTLIVKDLRTGKSVEWRIRDFMNFGGLIKNY